MKRSLNSCDWPGKQQEADEISAHSQEANRRTAAHFIDGESSDEVRLFVDNASFGPWAAQFAFNLHEKQDLAVTSLTLTADQINDENEEQ